MWSGFFYRIIFLRRIVGILASLIIVVYAAKIDQSQGYSDDSKQQKNNETGEQNQRPSESTSDLENDTDIYRRPGGGGGSSGGGSSGGGSSGGGSAGGGSAGARPPPGGNPNTRPRNNTAAVNTKSTLLLLPILYLIVAN